MHQIKRKEKSVKNTQEEHANPVNEK